MALERQRRGSREFWAVVPDGRRVGPFPSRHDARAWAARAKANEGWRMVSLVSDGRVVERVNPPLTFRHLFATPELAEEARDRRADFLRDQGFQVERVGRFGLRWWEPTPTVKRKRRRNVTIHDRFGHALHVPEWPSQEGLTILRRHYKAHHPGAFKASTRKGLSTKRARGIIGNQPTLIYPKIEKVFAQKGDTGTHFPKQKFFHTYTSKPAMLGLPDGDVLLTTDRAKIAQATRARNVAMGFTLGTGEFHPIRASKDYDPRAVGELTRWRHGRPPRSHRGRSPLLPKPRRRSRRPSRSRGRSA